MQQQLQHQSISISTYLFVHRHILIIVSICQTRHNTSTVVYRTAAADAAADAAAAAQLLLLLLQFMMLQERFDDDPATLVSTKIS